MKAVLHFNASTGLRARLAALRDIDIVVVDETDDDGFAREMAQADVLLHVLKPVTADMIAAAPKLRLIQKIGVGVNTIDRAAAQRAGVAVANMPGTNTQAVAEHALALMLATLRRVPVFDRATRAGQGWTMPPDRMEAIGEIGGRRVGFVGYGAVPQRLTPVLQALGAEVRYWTRAPKPQAPDAWLPFDALLATSDIVSLHIPATPDTAGLIDGAALARMKPGAILINTARGELIDQTALRRALDSGPLAGAGLDVFAAEPVPEGDPLIGCDGLVATPHVAWLTPETLDRSLAVILENCRRLGDNRPLVNAIPYP